MDDSDAIRELVKDISGSHIDQLSGALPECWSTLVELGLVDVGIDESAGGSGGSLQDLQVVVHELGRYAMSTPLIEHSVATHVLGHAAPGVITLLISDALDTQPGNRSPVTLRGVRWGRHARQLVVVSDTRSGVIDLEDARVNLGANVAAEPYDEVIVERDAIRELDAAPACDSVIARLGALWAHALMGCLEATYDLTRSYVRTRVQFGAPLIELPAVSTRLAAMKANLILAGSALARMDETLSAVAVARE